MEYTPRSRWRIGFLVLLVLPCALAWWRLGPLDRGAIEAVEPEPEGIPAQNTPPDPLEPLDATTVPRRAVGTEPTVAGEDAPEPRGSESTGTVVRTRFVDPAGTPIAGVELRVRDANEAVESNLDGLAELTIDGANARPSRALVLQARARGFARDRRIATATPGTPLLLGDWRLVPGGSVEGSVVDEAGRGLSGAQVACLREGLTDRDWERSRRDSLEGLWRPDALAVSAADGSFVLEEVPAGRTRIVAVTDDRPAGRSDLVDVPQGGWARGVEIRMEAPDGGTTIAGTVLDPGGRAVPHAELRIAAYRASYGITADEEGRFTLRLNDRKPCDVTALDPERRYRETTRRKVEPGTKDLVLQLAPAPEMELAVRSRTGDVVELFAVAVIARHDGEVLAFQGEQERPGGIATLGAPAQDFRIEVRANGYLPARLGPFPAAAPPAKVACTLDPAGGLRGIVLADGQPVAGATVGLYTALETHETYNGFPLRTEREPVNETQSGEGGAFSLSVEEAGLHYLRAEADGYALAELGPFQLSPTGQREERIELGAGGTLEVRVRSSEGSSVAGRLVAVSRGDGLARTQRSDEQGLLVWRRLTPGGWQVSLTEQEIDPAFGVSRFDETPAREIPANCRVFEGETTRIDLWLDGGETGACRLDGRLVIDGKPAEGWLAALLLEGSEVESRPFVEPGVFRLSTDEPGSYRLSVRPETIEPGVMLVVSDAVELYEGTTYWSLELETATLEGKLAATEGEDSLVLYRWERGSVQCFVPIVPGEDGLFRCRVPAGRGVIVRGDPGTPLEEQTPVVLRELTVEAGKTTTVDL